VVDGSGAGNFASNAIQAVHQPADAYQAWATLHGVDGSPAGQLDDDDRDGIAQLLEFAFNLDPSLSDGAVYDPARLPAAGLPRMVVGAGPLLSLQYLRRKGTSGLTYTPQFGPSPADFTDATGTPAVEDLGVDWERVTVADPAGSGVTKRFGRVVVTLAPP
jgi:hypothetical protein